MNITKKTPNSLKKKSSSNKKSRLKHLRLYCSLFNIN